VNHEIGSPNRRTFMSTPRSALVSPGDRGKLGQYLWDLRHAAGMTLREVEEASEVSNAYVSQLETGKITKASPDILHRLSETYSARLPRNGPVTCSFQQMMELAGHILPEKTTGARRGRLPTFASEALTPEEEEELLKYLAFLRMRKGTK
jgi:HTH-type transcriptional regulator, competence development regulator